MIRNRTMTHPSVVLLFAALAASLALSVATTAPAA